MLWGAWSGSASRRAFRPTRRFWPCSPRPLGDGSVRDSLSALDQGIACCRTELKAAEVRDLLGTISLDSLHRLTQALAASDSRGMLEVVDELERNGHRLQHFCRELARYFRNLLVAKIAGQETRLTAATPAERKRLREIAESFSDQDLTRYLRLTLNLFGDLQRSTQPRLHTEIGLLRLVEAGRLLPIEEAIAVLGGGSNPPAVLPLLVQKSTLLVIPCTPQRLR